MTNEQRQVLMSLEDYYESDTDSFGHGRDDHVATVILRACIIAKMLSESGTRAIHDVYSQDEICTIAESTQDHNVDFKIPIMPCDKIDLSKSHACRYEARSIYGMITADADKTADPVSETIRMIKYATEKMVKEGKSEVVLQYKLGEAKINVRDNNGEYIADMARIKKNCYEQLYSRYGKYGTDRFSQIDYKYETDFISAMYKKMHDMADCLADGKPPKEAYEACYAYSNQLLIKYGDNSGKAVMEREVARFGIDGSDTSIFDDAVDFVPDIETYMSRSYEIPQCDTSDARIAQIEMLDSELSATAALTENLEALSAEIGNPDTSLERQLQCAKEVIVIQNELTKKNNTRNALRSSYGREFGD